MKTILVFINRWIKKIWYIICIDIIYEIYDLICNIDIRYMIYNIIYVWYVWCYHMIYFIYIKMYITSHLLYPFIHWQIQVCGGAFSSRAPQPSQMRSLPRHDLLGEERWPFSQRRARSLFLDGLLLGSVCTGIQVKFINHCQAVRIKQ